MTLFEGQSRADWEELKEHEEMGLHLCYIAEGKGYEVCFYVNV